MVERTIIGGRTGIAVAGDMVAMWNGSHDENMTTELLSLSKLALIIRGDM